MPNAGALYVVATPIGNLGDISQRALDTLRQVSVVAAEDTRRTRQLLAGFSIEARCISLHEHNEAQRCDQVLGLLEQGDSVALVSDAGTPLLSDPGFVLVRAARQAGFSVVPVPGPSALTAALSVAGLPTNRFVFEGFLPARAAERRARLEALSDETRTLVFYESPHRITAALEDLSAIMGAERQLVLARELTKVYETVLAGSCAELSKRLADDPQQRKGEFVLLVAGAPPRDRQQIDAEAERVLGILAADLPAKVAARLASRITGVSRNALYALAVALADQRQR